MIGRRRRAALPGAAAGRGAHSIGCVIRPEGAGGPDRDLGGSLGGRMGAWGRRLLIAGLIAAALAIAGAVALLVAGNGSRTVTVTYRSPGAAPSEPARGGSRPVGATTAIGRCLPLRATRTAPPPPSQPCAAGSTRFTTGRQVALTARAGASVDRLAVLGRGRADSARRWTDLGPHGTTGRRWPGATRRCSPPASGRWCSPTAPPSGRGRRLGAPGNLPRGLRRALRLPAGPPALATGARSSGR